MDIDFPEPSLIVINQFLNFDVFNLFLQGGLLLFLLVFSAIISGSEVAFFSLSQTEIKKYAKEKNKRLTNAVNLLKSPDKLLANILIVNNLINVAIITLSAYFTWSSFGKSAYVFFVLTFVVTAVIIFCGEIIPKVYASKNKKLFIKTSSLVLIPSNVIFKPLILMLIKISQAFKNNKRELLESSKEELNKAMSLTIDKSTSKEEKDILKGIINFGSIKVKEIMKSRVDIVAFEIDESFEKISELINKSGYSRIPVFKETIDNIEGVLYVKDLLPHLNDKNFDWTKKIRPAFFVPENKNIDVLFKDFQEKRVHLSLVIDEYGGVSGLVTLEDIIEEIVGDIKDEFDFEEDFYYKKIDSNTFLFDGKTSLNDLCKVLNIHKDFFDTSKGESESLGGLILELNSKIPSVGDKIKFDNFIFTIMSVDNKRIKRVRVFKKTKG
ncbi:MAG: gliding motility-associated protein GldE [Bacteroidota bacterium]|nr:gliding motility-associated protein GldE [Bacteroidota bacterium]